MAGGLWLTKACHDFDYLSWLAGGEPQTVYAVGNLSHYRHRKDVGPRCRDCRIKETCPDFYDLEKPLDDWFDEAWRNIQKRMDQTGAMAPDVCLFNSDTDTIDNGIATVTYDNDVRMTYTLNVLSAKTTRQVRIVGTEGMIEADLHTATVDYTQRHTNAAEHYDLTEEVKGSHGGADKQILDDFFAVCRAGAEPTTKLTDGRKAVRLSLAATQSCDSGKVVSLA